MKFEEDIKYDFCDVLLKPKRSDLSSRKEVNLERTIKFKYSGREWTGVPIMTSNMDTIGTFEMYKVLSRYKMITVFHKFYSIEDFRKLREEIDLDPNYYMITTGISDNDFTRTCGLINELNPYFLMIDIANGYSTKFMEFCKNMRSLYPKMTIFAGNIATGDMVKELLLYSKVDVVKCGIGSGQLCITRTKTGVGVPQLSVSIECSESANGLNGHIISDGGCNTPGDISKALCGGAHFVMLGGMLGGHLESGGELITENGKQYKMIYGMSSKLAQDKYYGGMNSYRSSEGKVRKILYKGSVEETIQDILGGLRSTGTYIGASRIKDFPKCATFLKVNRVLNTNLDRHENIV